ncbi:MAG TPA: signal peptidase I, partial [Acidimicrobiales bacterium]|nr:signal peptidase I [Acidimicrobiales bacterium]
MGRRRLRGIGAGLVTAAGLVVIVALATHAVDLVTTHGVSMLPRFHTGDLAVIVPGAPYHVGEIVGYHSPLLHITVLHRIVAEHDGLFTFKGDNNHFLDPTKLPASAIQGRLWLHVPKLGMVLQWLRSPVGLGLVAFGLVAVGLGAGSARRHRARGRAAAGTGRGSGPKHAAEDDLRVGWWPVVLPALALAGLALLAAVAWARPTTRPGLRLVPYTERVTFSYTANAPVGVTYPTGSLSSGDPVFLRLVDTLHVLARYGFAAEGATPSD